MIHFEKQYFQKFKFTPDQLRRYLANIDRDLEIAGEDPFPVVRFSYSYQVLIKCGVTLIAKLGQVKVRSVPGHHVKVLEKLGRLLEDEEIFRVANAMRMKRNDDFYGGGIFVSQKEADDYLEFVTKVVERVKKIVS